MRVRQLLLIAGCGVASASARADVTSISGGSARAIGRAGTGLVSDDGAGALQLDPAALARRDSLRVQLGVGFTDDAVSFIAERADAPDSRDQAGSSVLPQLAVIAGAGDWVFGGSIATVGAFERAMRDPREIGDPAQLGAVFEYRYAGIASQMRRDALTVGAARRVGDSLAIGAAVGVSRLRVTEVRRIWAGFESAIGDAEVGDPIRDLQLRMDGHAYVPSATAGVFVAPADTPLELGLAVGWVRDATVEGELQGEGVSDGPTLLGRGARARLTVRQPLAVRAGARYVGETITAEVGGDLWLATDRARASQWELGDAGNRPQVADPSTVRTPLEYVPSRVSSRTHGAVRGAIDVEAIAGFLWLTGGYAYEVGATASDRLSPTFGSFGGHTAALGVEGTAGGITYTVGWSRTWATGRASRSAWMLDNPFRAGDERVPTGSYDASVDQIGVMVDVTFGDD